MHLDVDQRLKLEILSGGIALTDPCSAYLASANQHRPLTPADYASTSGLILRIERNVWVNAPVAEHNPNFVDAPRLQLDVSDDGLVLRAPGRTHAVEVWIPPGYHDELNPIGRPWTDYVFTHSDRARLAPIGGCAMTCKFCNLPYEHRYLTKPVSELTAAVRRAIEDPIQPARHLLISGGTPRAEDVPYLRDVYRKILSAFPGLDVDIMMAPVEGVFDLPALRDLGVHQLSVNLEIFDPTVARTLMPHKYRQGVAHYLAFIEEAASTLGSDAVRSMLMVGLEPVESTIAGVQAILDAGGIPVLSPFRPDPATPLRGHPLLTAVEMERVYAEARACATAAGRRLGPDCGPCTHNTLTFLPRSGPDASTGHELAMIR